MLKYVQRLNKLLNNVILVEFVLLSQSPFIDVKVLETMTICLGMESIFTIRQISLLNIIVWSGQPAK